jgi:hypothetical protein
MRMRVEEAFSMAAITFRKASRTMRLRQQFGAVLSICRDWLDAFVSNRMRHAAAEAENVYPADAFVELVRGHKQDL